MEIKLTENEIRVLGALIEKDITTPEYYPLSLNALVNACNQKTNRDPVMQLDEDAVRDALEGLQQQRMAGPARGADSRVTSTNSACRKYSTSRARRLRCCACCCCAVRRRRASCEDAPSACTVSRRWKMCIGDTEIDAARAAAGEGSGSTAGNEGIAVCALAGGGLMGRGSPGAGCGGFAPFGGCGAHCAS